MGNAEGGKSTPQDFQFHELFEVTDLNGLCFNKVCLPEELLFTILSYVRTKDILKCSEVCKRWCNMIKSQRYWQYKYNRIEYPKKAKALPWYCFYSYFATNNFQNLLRNGNGQQKFAHWQILKNGGDRFKIENVPQGADPLPSGVPEFYGRTSCFATSYDVCWKFQVIQLENKRLLCYILDKFMPHIYVSEWTAGRFDCGSRYMLIIRGYKEAESLQSLKLIRDVFDKKDALFFQHKKTSVEQWQGGGWNKVEMTVTDYPLDVRFLVFEHIGSDNQFWAGHYGPKMAGGVVKVLFESLEPLGENEAFRPRKECCDSETHLANVGDNA